MMLLLFNLRHPRHFKSTTSQGSLVYSGVYRIGWVGVGWQPCIYRIAWVGVGGRRRCKTRQSERGLDNKGTGGWGVAVATASGLVRSLVRGGETLLRTGGMIVSRTW